MRLQSCMPRTSCPHHSSLERRGALSTALPDGRNLVTGGYQISYRFDGEGDYFLTRDAAVWEPVSRLWSQAGSLLQPRMNLAAIVLPSGVVLIAGGTDADGYHTRTGCELSLPETSVAGVAGSVD
jgi:hypothetical protein